MSHKRVDHKNNKRGQHPLLGRPPKISLARDSLPLRDDPPLAKRSDLDSARPTLAEQSSAPFKDPLSYSFLRLDVQTYIGTDCAVYDGRLSASAELCGIC
jgi:hypothetical protein